MDERSSQKGGASGSTTSRRRYLLAILLGFVGALFIWIVTPYNNLVVGNRGIGDSYLPVYAMFVTLLLILLINPLLRRFARPLALERGQLAVILAILLVACSIPGYGLLRTLPYNLAQIALDVRENAALAKEYEGMNLSPKLFPDKIGYALDTPASDRMMGELMPGESIPWGAWVWPLCVWSVLLLSLWMMMIGLAVIVFPQWRHNERLAFPLLTVYQHVLEQPRQGRLLPPLFRCRTFWITAGIVFVLHAMQGAAEYNPEKVPAIPLHWDLGGLFTEEPWNHLPSFIYRQRLYFAFIGIAYFMPNRISFSIWFFALAYAAYQMLGSAYFPPFQYGSISDHRMGAMLALAVFILWLGRAQWARVFGCLVRRARSDEDRRDRAGAALFALGSIGIFAWLVWAGMQPGWALMLLGFGFVACLVITRIVCETGVPFIRTYSDPFTLMALAPTAWIKAASLFFSFIGYLVFSMHSRTCATTMATHGLGLNEEISARRQRQLTFILVATLVMGVVVCGAAHLHAAYHHGMSLDGVDQPLNGGYARIVSNWSSRPLLERAAGQISRPTYNRPGHIAFGAALAGGLQWACLAIPRWPLHPVGIMMAYISYGQRTWFSILLGWLIKTLLVRYGGSRLYHAARPAFLGLVLGEVFAALFWGVMPAVLLALGVQYRIFDVLPF
ncbi:MAG: hypothetical protein JXR37_31350 [Kiritimatiellae bacterium]|nr:hypothetical protein [Kiritimatiellia bacterium]